MTITTMTYDVPARDNRALGVLLGVTIAVLGGAGIMSCAAATQPHVRSAERVERSVSDCLLAAVSCAEVTRCVPEVACTEMTEAQARREGLLE